MAVLCGNCHNHHESAAAVRACYGHVGTLGQTATKTRAEAPGGTVCPRHGVELDQRGNCWEHEVEAAVQRREREEDEAVARYKADRDHATITSPAPMRAKDYGKNVPAGSYALQDAKTGTITFYQIDKPTTGKWAGYTFAKLLIGSPGEWRRERVSDWKGVLAAIEAFGTEAALRLFAEKARCCGLCKSPISTVRSRAAGIGPHCADKHGYFYPSEKQAREMLNERGINPDDQSTWWEN